MSPLEFSAIPEPSPRWISGGSFRKFAFESNGISRIASCADGRSPSTTSTSAHNQYFTAFPPWRAVIDPERGGNGTQSGRAYYIHACRAPSLGASHAANELLSRRLKAVPLTLSAAGVLGAVTYARQAQPPGTFTAAQADGGRALYQARCAGCHLPDLGGRGEAPPLAGANFLNV